MTLRKAIVIAGAFAIGFLVSELASVRGAHAQSGFQIYVQGVGTLRTQANQSSRVEGGRLLMR